MPDQGPVNPFDPQHPQSQFYGVDFSGDAPPPSPRQALMQQLYPPTQSGTTPASGYAISAGPPQPSGISSMLGKAGDFMNQAMTAFNPATAIPAMIMQQPSIQKWSAAHPDASDAISNVMQLGAGSVSGEGLGATLSAGSPGPIGEPWSKHVSASWDDAADHTGKLALSADNSPWPNEPIGIVRHVPAGPDNPKPYYVVRRTNGNEYNVPTVKLYGWGTPGEYHGPKFR